MYRLDISNQEKKLLNEIIRIERKRMGYKQSSFEHICSRATLNKIEKNKCVVNDELYDEILNFMGKSFDYSHSCLDENMQTKLDNLYKRICYYDIEETSILINQLIMELVKSNGIIENYYLDILIAVREQFFYDIHQEFDDCEYLINLIQYLPEPMKTFARYLLIKSSEHIYKNAEELIKFVVESNVFDEFTDQNPIMRSEYLDYLFLSNRLLTAYDYCKDSIKYYQENNMINRQCDMYKRLIMITLNTSSSQLDEVINSVKLFLESQENNINELKRIQIKLQLGVVYFKLEKYEETYNTLKDIDLVKYKKVLPEKIMMNYSLEKLERVQEVDYSLNSLDEYKQNYIDLYYYFKLKHSYINTGKCIDYEALEHFVLSHRDSFTVNNQSLLGPMVIDELREIMLKTKKYWLKNLIQEK